MHPLVQIIEHLNPCMAGRIWLESQPSLDAALADRDKRNYLGWLIGRLGLEVECEPAREQYLDDIRGRGLYEDKVRFDAVERYYTTIARDVIRPWATRRLAALQTGMAIARLRGVA